MTAHNLDDLMGGSWSLRGMFDRVTTRAQLECINDPKCKQFPVDYITPERAEDCTKLREYHSTPWTERDVRVK